MGPKFHQQVNNWEIRNSTVVQKIKKTWKALYWKTVEQKPITQRGNQKKENDMGQWAKIVKVPGL